MTDVKMKDNIFAIVFCGIVIPMEILIGPSDVKKKLLLLALSFV